MYCKIAQVHIQEIFISAFCKLRPVDKLNFLNPLHNPISTIPEHSSGLPSVAVSGGPSLNIHVLHCYARV